MERQEYLEYFINKKKKPSSKTIYNQHINQKDSRSLHVNVNRFDKKVLPHISEEYQYKVTNQLLVQKIINPKRDKLIIQNFQKSLSRPGTRQGKSRNNTTVGQQHNCKSLQIRNSRGQDPQPGSINMYTRMRLRQALSKKKHKNIKSYEKQFNLALQNERMGRRIINTKSSVEEILKKTFYTYKSKSKQNDKQNFEPDLKGSFIRGRQNTKIYFSGKINNGVKVFFNPIRDDEKQPSRSHSLNQSKVSQVSKRNINNTKNVHQTNTLKDVQNSELNIQRKLKTSGCFRTRFLKSGDTQLNSSKHIQTSYPQSFKIFGKGPTILMIYDLQISCNPPLKDDSVIILELITHEKQISIKRFKQRSIRTTPLTYEFFKLSTKEIISNCIRFAINVSEIGDFVPLRIYRVHGVEIQQLGIIDVDLAAFRYRKSEMIEGTTNNFAKEFKENKYGQKMERDIISGKASSSLRKNLLNKPAEIRVDLSYKIYPKRFKPVAQTQN